MSTVTGRRVVVTGMGVVSSIGTGVPEFAHGLRAGSSGAKPITAFDTSGFEYAYGCEVADFRPERWIHHVPVDELGRASQFSVAAARMAVDDADVAASALRDARGMISIGTTDGEFRELDELTAVEIGDGPEAMSPVRVRSVPAARLSAAVAAELELDDVETVTIPTACAAGNYAIGYGYDAVRSGEADFALAGGADAVCRKTFAGFYRLGIVAREACRPFDSERTGILTGEGGGVLFLESLDSAVARGARIYAEVLGYGLNCDAHHPVAPHGETVGECLSLALRDAGVHPSEVDFISAHGTGTDANDVTEAGAIREVFAGDPPRVVSMKSMLGHAMGAASALASIGCALALDDGFVPPTINHEHTDPRCAVDCVPNESVEADPRVVLNNGLAFGGNNCVVVFGKSGEHSAPGFQPPQDEGGQS